MSIDENEKAGAKNEKWLARRPKPSNALIARALDILDRPTGQPPEESDRIPDGYVRRRKSAAKRAASRLKN